MSLVTIAVASYNNCQYLGRCLESVIRQSYSNLEVLIVDDGSKDDSVSLAKQYEKDDSRIRVITKENGGLSSSRQLALESAKGDYICFIDADDYLGSEYVKDFVNKIKKDGSDICVCSTIFEDSEGNRLISDEQSFNCVDTATGFKLLNIHLSTSIPYNIVLSDSWDKMYSVEFLRKSGVTFCLPKGFNGSDSVFNWKVAFHEPIYSTISNANYHHVIYKSSAVHRKKKNLFEGFKMIIEALIEEAKSVSSLEALRGCICRQYCDYLRTAIDDEFCEDDGVNESHKILKEIKKSDSDFRHKHAEIKLLVSIQKTSSSKIFVILYKYFTYALPLYITVRHLLVSAKVK